MPLHATANDLSLPPLTPPTKTDIYIGRFDHANAVFAFAERSNQVSVQPRFNVPFHVVLFDVQPALRRRRTRLVHANGLAGEVAVMKMTKQAVDIGQAARHI